MKFIRDSRLSGILGPLRAVASYEFVHGVDQRPQAAIRLDPGFGQLAEPLLGAGPQFT
jgi:hypothetical protein